MADTLRLQAGLKDLEKIRRFVEDSAAGMGITGPMVDDLVLAVDEAAANAIEHGYGGQTGPLELEVSHAGDELTVRLRDRAPAFDPTLQAAPDLTLPLEERPIGGVGIHLARQVLDVFSYRRTEQGENELTMMKRADAAS